MGEQFCRIWEGKIHIRPSYWAGQRQLKQELLPSTDYIYFGERIDCDMSFRIGVFIVDAKL